MRNSQSVAADPAKGVRPGLWESIRRAAGRAARQRLTQVAAGTALLLALISARKDLKESDLADRAAFSQEAMEKFGRLGKGYLVWERHRDNSWQIWSKQLDGTGEGRLVPAEEGRDHFCPKVSPDGSLMAYMSYPAGRHPYPGSKVWVGTLWLMNLRTQARQILADEAQSYAEDRAVTWRDNNTLCYINVRGETIELNLGTKAGRKVIDYHNEKFGYLPSPNLEHATGGTPEFAMVKPGGTLVHQKFLDGCQPYFTSDSLWGFWMAGAGGPINAMFLPTRHSHPILQRRDSRLPEGRDYAYFPMISPCMRLLAFGASTNEHSHFDGNYNIFLAMVNPVNLRMIGKPVRYTLSENCDRYPDVFRRELELGTHFVEGATKVRFDPPGKKGVYDFDFGNGKTAHGRIASHTFKEPGEYWVTAKRGKGSSQRTLRGYVHVDPPTSPSVIQMQRLGERELLVKFDKRVNLANATVRIGDGDPLPAEATAADHGMRVQLPASLPAESAVTIDGVHDTAQQPGKMPRSVISLRAMDWPVSQKGLVFAWRDAFANSSDTTGADGRLSPAGLAFWNHQGALQLRGGWCDTADSGKRISDACARSNEFSLEAALVSEPADKADNKPDRESVILALADPGSGSDLVLKQRGKLLSLELRSGKGQPAKTATITDLFGPESGEHRHVMLTFSGGQLSLYIDGRSRRVNPGKLGDISNWQARSLRFGASPDGASPWRGSIERVAFYDRALTKDEVASHAKSWEFAVESRSIPYEWTVLAKLLESTPAPTLADIQPYKEALVRRLYEVQENLTGDGLLPAQIVVSQWIWLGMEAMPAQALKVGDTVRLTLHEAEAHPELKSLVIKDSLTEGIGAKLLHDASEWDQPLKSE